MLAAHDRAPVFSLPDVTGAPHSLAEMLQHGPVLVALYKVSCPVCQLTLPFLQRIANGGIQIAAVCQDDAATAVRFMKSYGVSMLTLLDSHKAGYPVSNAFGITHVPSLFLIETDGSISFAGSGFSKKDLEALAERAGSPIFRPEDNVPAWKAG